MVKKRSLTPRIIEKNRKMLLKSGFSTKKAYTKDFCMFCAYVNHSNYVEYGDLMRSSQKDEYICSKHARLLQLIW